MSASKRTRKASQVVNAGDIAATFDASLKAEASKLSETLGHPPTLVGILANDDSAALKYAEWTAKSCELVGINFVLEKLASAEDVSAKISELNESDQVQGVMVYYPCFGSMPSFFGGSVDDRLRDQISPKKDVEGLCDTYRRHLYANTRYLPKLHTSEDSKFKCLLPCTPLACVKILEHLGCYDSGLKSGSRLAGKTCTVINRSEIVGRPLSAMLANDGATVFSVDIDSIFELRRGKMCSTKLSTKDAVSQSDIVVLGVPNANYKLDVNLIKQGAVVLNVSSFANVNKNELLEKTTDVKYVGRVGRVTVSMLERNLLRLARQFFVDDLGKSVDIVEAGGRVVW